MVAINTNPGQNKELAAWRAKGRYTFPVALCDRDYASTTYRVGVQPTNLLVNAEHKAIFRYVGYANGNEKTMEAEIRELLGLDPFGG